MKIVRKSKNIPNIYKCDSVFIKKNLVLTIKKDAQGVFKRNYSVNREYQSLNYLITIEPQPVSITAQASLAF